jgi:TRAP-type transport system small permease protein
VAHDESFNDDEAIVWRPCMKTPHPTLYSVLVLVGGAALIGAMGIDVLAVLGRHTGIPLLGSIELVQVLVAITGVMALMISTLNDRHAVVRLVLARLSGTMAMLFKRFNALGLAVFLLALALGSAWTLLELWSSHEETELWLLPYRPMRVLVVAALVVTTGLVLRKAWQGGDE